MFSPTFFRSFAAQKLPMGLAIFFWSIALLGQAQEYSHKEWRQKAEQAQKLGDRYTAINLYEKAYEQATKVKAAPEIRYGDLYQLAELNRKIRNYSVAADYYEQLTSERSSQYLKARFYTSLMIKQTGRYDLAKVLLKKVLDHYDGPDRRMVKKRAEVALKGCRMAMNEKDESKAKLHHSGTVVNSAYTEFSPLWMNDSVLLYASRKLGEVIRLKRGKQPTGAQKTRFFTAHLDSPGHWADQGQWEEVVKDPSKNVGNGAFSPDKERFYFTKCEPDKQSGTMQCAIYMSRKEGGRWHQPEKLNEEINKPGCTNTQPAVGLMQKGRGEQEVLFFVSNRDRGRGGKDIWFAFYDKADRQHERPRNAGRKINTPWDEVTPNMDLNRNMLYFSSEGHPGYGGLDVFRIPVTGRRITADPENMGRAVNSEADDLYFNTNQNQQGVFVSNRRGSIALKHSTCCDDIFTVAFPEAFEETVEGVVETKAILKEEDTTLKPLPDAQVTLYRISGIGDSGKKPVWVDSTSDSGRFQVTVKQDEDYQVVVEKDGYLNEQTDTVKGETLANKGEIRLEVEPVPEEPVVVPNIYYHFDKASLKAESKKALDTSVLKLMRENPKLILEIRSHTDSKGSKAYNKELSRERAQSVVDYLTGKGIDPERLESKGFGETQPIAPNTNPDGTDNPEGRRKNRRTEFKIIGELQGNKKVIYEE